MSSTSHSLHCLNQVQSLTSLAVWNHFLADMFSRKLLKQLLLLTTEHRVYSFVMDNKIPVSPAFDPPLSLLSEAAKMQPPNI